MLCAIKLKVMPNNILYVEKIGDTVSYGNKDYRVQNDRGHRHIVVYVEGERKKITIKQWPFNLFGFYVLSNLFQEHPCSAIQYLIDKKFNYEIGL